MLKTVFFFSHSPQIKWYSVFAEVFKEYSNEYKVIIFVHGVTDKQYAKTFQVYDEVIDLIEGFKYLPELDVINVPISQGLLELEAQRGKAFFWEDARIDRWIRAKNRPSFTRQYLNFSFNILNKLYNKYNPVCGFGESTAAIYRFAHHLFDRDSRFYMAPMSTRYFDRFHVETDWYWLWEDMLNLYHKYLEEGIPEDLMQSILPHYNNITQKGSKPTSMECFNKKQDKGFKEFRWFDIKKYFSVIRNVRTISDWEMKNNVRYSVIEKKIQTKLKRHWRHKKNFKALEKLSKQEIPNNIKFCVYFLHFSPEYTVDSLGKFYRDEEHLIKNISMSLPADHLLLVKEHPAMAGLREKTFFHEILKCNNIVLLHPSVDSHQVIKQASLIFSIIGSAALEAMFVGKQAIVFGKNAFTETNTISFCSSFWELEGLVNKKIKLELPKDKVKKHALALLAAKYEGSAPGKIPLSAEAIDPFIADTQNIAVVKQSFKQALVKYGLPQ